MSLEEHKRQERAQAIGLFRYQLICPALDAGLSTRQRGRVVREIAGRRHIDPFGTQVQIARATLDRWIRRYRAGGFEALVPESRRLATRTDVQVLELAASLKRENPATATALQRCLRHRDRSHTSGPWLLVNQKGLHDLNHLGPRWSHSIGRCTHLPDLLAIGIRSHVERKSSSMSSRTRMPAADSRVSRDSAKSTATAAASTWATA